MRNQRPVVLTRCPAAESRSCGRALDSPCVVSPRVCLTGVVATQEGPWQESQVGGKESGKPWERAELHFGEEHVEIKSAAGVERFPLSETDFIRQGKVYRVIGGERAVFFEPDVKGVVETELRLARPGYTGPVSTTAESLTTMEMKRTLLRKLTDDEKYDRPFRRGEMTMVNVFGGSWNDYAQVVFSMAILDTLLNIEEGIKSLGGRIEAIEGSSEA